MPHIHLMTTANLAENVDIEQILERLVQKLSEMESVQPVAVKAYHTLFTNWRMGEGAAHGFAHCQLSLLTGRSSELRQKISDEMYEVMKAAFRQSIAEGEATLTLEYREMDAETYRK